jgi:EAL domain-containing protein (putative c-di-GMP-specific phosphodiesterase class I)
MTSEPDDAVIVRSTIELAHNLGMHVVAEGVETSEHWDELSAQGCDTAQGYYLTRPLPAEELTVWLADAGEDVPRAA